MSITDRYRFVFSSLSANKVQKPDLVVVTKERSIEQISAVIELGHVRFGENRVIDACQKWSEVKSKNPNVILHLIGHLQTNKVKEALQLFDVFETIDSLRLAEEIAKVCDKVEIDISKKKFFLQINVGCEEQKTGLEIDKVEYFLQNTPLQISGFMCIPPNDQNTPFYFLMLKKLAEKHSIKELSMGMSKDFQQAIALGSTNVRVGSFIFE